MAKKGKQLDNFNEVNVEKKGNRVDIFRGSGGTDPNDNDTKTRGHSHTVIEDNKVVYDRDEYGNTFLDTRKGSSPAPITGSDES
ncbi:hypothetical protein KC669_01030 [Candidatus Dojkabacteria bacterium]|uniref:DUF3892 domain-containing protein n=1 Tax=Candidatus Dojkabacteria bacterium TaxID=2099670 RepID=A0A955LAJ7_9BACT|nr:hypothetical protein [Candidatus Dojkabacteria bacterium]